MLKRVIEWSVENKLVVLVLTAFLVAGGIVAVKRTPLEALPDLSDVQVIIQTDFDGQAPQIVEDQITYPVASEMLKVPGAQTVRGYSFFGVSFVYIIFEDGTDLYWARSRVLEYLSAISGKLPEGAQTALGPDATGLGWVYQYVLEDTSGTRSLADLRSIQDWYLRYQLTAVPGVSEVASIGGFEKTYEVTVDPASLRGYGIPVSRVMAAIRASNQDVGAMMMELSEREYMVRGLGYLKNAEDIENVVVDVTGSGTPIRIADVANVQLSPGVRRGVADLDGRGDVVGGIVVMRFGENALATIDRVKEKLVEIESGLPAGLVIRPVYDRSDLIHRSIATLREKLLEESVVVALVAVVFLFHARSALVAILTLPVGILTAFVVMRMLGLGADIMSLGGIAIAIGAMIDAAIVMIENMHKHLERDVHAKRQRLRATGHPAPKDDGVFHTGELTSRERWEAVVRSSKEVGPALFVSLLIITVSFLPVFTLEAQEGRLFKPLAWTKTLAMAGSSLLALTLVPVMMGLFIRGRLHTEQRNPVSRALMQVYRPIVDLVLRWRWPVIASAFALLALTWIPYQRIGGEFMPPLNEGTLLFMPTTLPGLSVTEAGDLLQRQDRIIASFPEVASVWGKAGRAETATDPAPLEMFETTIQLKPREQWRPGMTPEKLAEELDRVVKVPGLANIWIPPIRNRIDMLATGIKSPIGVKVSGTDLAAIDRVAAQVEKAAKRVPGISSALAERLTGGRYIDVQIDRQAAARYGLNIADVQSVVASAIGGENIGETVEGLARFPINLRYPRELRDSPEKLRQLPIFTPMGQQITLGTVARVETTDGPPMLKSENARLSGWVYIDVRGRDLASVVADLRQAVAREVTPTPGVSIAYSGQFEFLERANARLKVVVPATLLIIFVLLYLTFKRFDEALLIMVALPFALTGGVWFLYLLGYHLSIATGVGFIALAGVAAEFGVVMLLYLKHALQARTGSDGAAQVEVLDDAIREGAVLRVRPKAMTVAVILAGLLPIVWGGGTGSEVMSRIAAPMLGGMITAPLLSMFVIPAAYKLMRRQRLRRQADAAEQQPAPPLRVAARR
jgi:Cu(I)/Ag(I) efflux system membrane protein CusA/SilA